MSKCRLLYIFVCFLVSAGGILQAQTASTPPAGSAERKAIMDVLRAPAEKDLEQKVIFQVDLLRVAGDLAFARVTPLQPDGSEIDYAQTKYREQKEEGMFDALGEALLRRTGKSWKVLEWRFGATDTEVGVWRERYHLPKSLLE